MRTQRDSGFTLLEILVALVVLGLVVAGLSQGVQFGLQAWGLQMRSLATRGELDSVDRALRRLIAETDPGDSVEHPHFVGGPTGLEFVTKLPAAAEGLTTQRANVALLVNRAHQMMLLWTPAPHVERLGQPSALQATELLRNVERLDLAYWRDASPGGGWQRTWSLPYLPALVRVHIVFLPGDPRRWPDIVAAPLLEKLER